MHVFVDLQNIGIQIIAFYIKRKGKRIETQNIDK